MKSYLKSDARARGTSALQPQATGVSYLKAHSFKSNSTEQRKDATVYRHNDDDVGYISSARRRVRDRDARTPSPSRSQRSDDNSIEALRKKVREKQILLDAVDTKDERAQEDDEYNRRDRREIEDLQFRIKRMQDEIDRHPNNVATGAGAEEKKQLKQQLKVLTDRLPELASRVRRTEQSIAEAKLELFRLREVKNAPETQIVGTGPGGAITESDRRKAKSRAMMQARLAALTGKAPSGAGDESSIAKKLEEETRRVNAERERNEQMIKDVEEGVEEFRSGLEESLRDVIGDRSFEEERRKWEEGIGLEDDTKDFIYELQKSTDAVRRERAAR